MSTLQSELLDPSLLDLSNDKEEIESLRQQVKTLKTAMHDMKTRHTASLLEEHQSKLEVVNEVAELNRQISGLKAKLSEVQRAGLAEAEEIVAEREKEIAALKDALNVSVEQQRTTAERREQLVQELHAAQAAREEAEEHLKAAHQHLSKKVRETTDLGERIKNLESSAEEAKGILVARGEALTLLEQTMQVLVQKEHALQRENHELRKCFDERQTHWEEKLEYVQAQLSQAQQEQERLKVYEERCQQIARHWDSMGKVLWEQRTQDSLLKSMVARQPPRSPHLLDLALENPGAIGNA